MAHGTTEDTCPILENRVSYETTSAFNEKLPFNQSDLAESNVAEKYTDIEDEDAFLTGIEDRIDNFLDSEGVFVSHVDDAKQALFGPFALTSRLGQGLPASKSSFNLSK